MHKLMFSFLKVAWFFFTVRMAMSSKKNSGGVCGFASEHDSYLLWYLRGHELVNDIPSSKLPLS